MSVSDQNCQLQKIVFGFHPYWAGSDYLNYQWNLISDLCYFSYEVDPSTGNPVTMHDWLTDPAIDSAQANGVKVHLCATIFSGHTSFFSNPTARQNLIDNLVSLVQQRNADGINMDIEAVPSSMKDSISAFMQDLSGQLKAAIPGGLISIDLPGIDWGNAFDIEALDASVDYFFIMGYDYYWNSSNEAGPVSPLYAMVSDNNISLSRTISEYETSGISAAKFILGIPYYGRQWRTEYSSIPSPTIGTGTALTYAVVRNNSSIYNSSNYTWEQNSFSSCYIFFQNDNWNQCFIGLEHDLRKKYDIVNYRDLAGIGIWALGYDDGHTELWQAISDKFSDCYIPLVYDTVFDSGGPTWNYYGSEDYTMTIDQGYTDMRYLTFTNFSLEEPFDSLWIYAGPDTTFPYLGGFTGTNNPGKLSSENGVFTVKFKSDAIYHFNGWSAVFHDGSMEVEYHEKINNSGLLVYPNPAGNNLTLLLPEYDKSIRLIIFDIAGRILLCKEFAEINNRMEVEIDVSHVPAGSYIINLKDEQNNNYQSKFMKIE